MRHRTLQISTIVLVIVILIQSISLAASDLDDAKKLIQPELEQFYRGLYNGEPVSLVSDYRTALFTAIDQAPMSAYSHKFLIAKIDMLYGKHFVLEERRWYDPSYGEVFLRKAREHIENILDEYPTPEAYALASEVRGSLFLLRPARSILTHGTAARSLSKKAHEADPNHIDVLVLRANEALYTPRFYGGDPALALELFTKALQLFQEHVQSGGYRDPVLQFTIYSGTGLTIRELGNEDLARQWLESSLTIYPRNPYIKEEIGH